MPDFKINNTENIFSWKITESITELFELVSLNTNNIDHVKSHTRPKRKKELLATRALVQSKLPNAQIDYINKRPILINYLNEISISNSKNIVVIMLNPSNTPTGIDIQFYADTVTRVKHKFLHPEEYKLPNIETKKILNIIWSVKETLYKAYSADKLEFKKQLIIKTIDLENNKVTGDIIFHTITIPFTVKLTLTDQYVLSWFDK